MQTIHWLGAGLSSIPGIRRLAGGPLPLVLWNRTLSKAEKAVAGLDKKVAVFVFDIDALSKRVAAGDIVVSMLPGSWHPLIAGLCIKNSAHFVSSSYISEALQKLDRSAQQKGLSLLNEVGLDPGLDHLMAHALVHAYKQSPEYDIDNTILFRSYCGGFPAQANDFRYKFSWSPLGVLKALKTPSRSIREGKTLDVQRPWRALTIYRARLPGGREENFEAYPNRDALPFINEYNFDPAWQIDEFVRGTLRLPGWAAAWKDIFAEIETLDGESGEARLQEMSDRLWQSQSYEDGEADRVVLSVELEARDKDAAIWRHSYAIDALGNEKGSAMARLVSLSVSLAVDAIASGKIRPGVSAAPSDPVTVQSWFNSLRALGEYIEHS